MRAIRLPLTTAAFCTTLLMFLLAGARPAQAFDTGHHADLTRAAMLDAGFNATCIRIAQLENWLVDYYSDADLTGAIKPQVAKMHFDNLATQQELQNYWGRLAVNTRIAIRNSVLARDRLRFLTIVGMTFHSVKAFYTHSNWVETHPRADGDPFRTETWFSAPPPAGMGVRTGSYPNGDPIGPTDHGDYFVGMNHDSYVRPRWEDAYVFAYVASREWLNACKKWAAEVDPDFWTLVRRTAVAPADDAALSADLEASYRISEWISDGGLGKLDGHWKGNGSGSAADFGQIAVTWTTAPDSIFVQQFKVKQWFLDIALTLTGANPPVTPVPAVPALAINQRAVIVRTVRFVDQSTGFLDLKFDMPFGTPDFYGLVTVGNELFVEATMVDKGDFFPSWTTIKFIPATTASVDIRYELWDEDGYGVADEQADINPALGAKALVFQFAVGTHNLTGDLTGVHDTLGTAVSSAAAPAESLRASVLIYVTERKLQ